MYACLGVNRQCHLLFWQNDRGLLRASAVTGGETDTDQESAQKVNFLRRKISRLSKGMQRNHHFMSRNLFLKLSTQDPSNLSPSAVFKVVRKGFAYVYIAASVRPLHCHRGHKPWSINPAGTPPPSDRGSGSGFKTWVVVDLFSYITTCAGHSWLSIIVITFNKLTSD